MRSRRPTTLLTSHYGSVPHTDEAFELAAARIRSWADVVERTLRDDLDTPEDTVRDALERLARAEFETDAHRPFEEQRYDVLGSIRMNAQGLARYWRKRWEREAASQAQPSAASRSAASNADGS
jgi:hypothetical protein